MLLLILGIDIHVAINVVSIKKKKKEVLLPVYIYHKILKINYLTKDLKDKKKIDKNIILLGIDN